MIGGKFFVIKIKLLFFNFLDKVILERVKEKVIFFWSSELGE